MKASAANATFSTRQWIVTGGAIIVVVASAAFLWSKLFPHTVADDANARMYICKETGKTFKHVLVQGETEPIKSPYTGRPTGYRAEACFWKKVGDGWKGTKEPHWVLVKAWMGEPGETICPVCGHVVQVHNPPPKPEEME